MVNMIKLLAISLPLLAQGFMDLPAHAATVDAATRTMLYNANCALCHGQAKRGQSAAVIQNAIRKNTGGMGSLKFLSGEQIQAIATF